MYVLFSVVWGRIMAEDGFMWSAVWRESELESKQSASALAEQEGASSFNLIRFTIILLSRSRLPIWSRKGVFFVLFSLLIPPPLLVLLLHSAPAACPSVYF